MEHLIYIHEPDNFKRYELLHWLHVLDYKVPHAHHINLCIDTMNKEVFWMTVVSTKSISKTLKVISRFKKKALESIYA